MTSTTKGNQVNPRIISAVGVSISSTIDVMDDQFPSATAKSALMTISIHGGVSRSVHALGECLSTFLSATLFTCRRTSPALAFGWRALAANGAKIRRFTDLVRVLTGSSKLGVLSIAFINTLLASRRRFEARMFSASITQSGVCPSIPLTTGAFCILSFAILQFFVHTGFYTRMSEVSSGLYW